MTGADGDEVETELAMTAVPQQPNRQSWLMSEGAEVLLEATIPSS